MYIPKHFNVSDEESIRNFIEENSFGQLISTHEGSLASTHMPFLYDAQNRKLLGHLAKANPQWQQIQSQHVLVTMQGDHAYVSPSWYESAGVPTWNYQALHLEGVAENFDDPERLKFVVDALTNKHESAYSAPWKPDYAASMLHGIVGIEISITSIQCKFKLSQNRSESDQTSVRDRLAESGHNALATAMGRT